MPDWQAVLPELVDQGVPINRDSSPVPVGGGDINDAWRVPGPGGPVFLKTAPAESADSLSAEAEALAEIAATRTLRVPGVLGCGITGPVSWLALEWLDLAPTTPGTQRLLGCRLADMHRHSAARHGWHRDNTIGSTPQINTPSDDWVAFYRDCRIGFQLDTAARYGYAGELQALGRRLMDSMATVFAGHAPAPSLLHGDLWGGNQSVCEDQPVIFDPATYYGDRETDLAMSRLFGGFSREFYAAYEERWPLPAGHEARVGVYQLYHVLNHLNLFGRSYLDRAIALLREALVEVS